MAAGLFSFAVSALLFHFFFGTAVEAGVSFSKLPKSLIVSATPTPGQVLKAGEDKFRVSWELNEKDLPKDGDGAYKNVKVSLCYAPMSQKDRGWRNTVDDLAKDKTCQFEIINKPYSKSNTTYEYLIKKDIPTATYFVRAYILDSNENEVGYGETTNAQKTTNLFQITGISGRHASLDIAAGCFSAFSIVSLLFFFYVEKRKAKK